MDDDTISIAGKTYFTNVGLAKAIKKSTRTVRRWDAAGKGPPKLKLGNTSIYDQDNIPGWIARSAVRRGRGRAARAPSESSRPQWGGHDPPDDRPQPGTERRYRSR